MGGLHAAKETRNQSMASAAIHVTGGVVGCLICGRSLLRIGMTKWALVHVEPKQSIRGYTLCVCCRYPPWISLLHRRFDRDCVLLVNCQLGFVM